MGGIYLLTAQGNAVVTVAGGSSAGRIANKTYDPSTNRLTAFVVIPQGASQIMLSFVNTSGHGVQNITLLQPNYDLTSQSNITNLMLTHLSRFSIIRFMDWMATNNNPDVNWNDSTPLWWPQYTTPKHNPWDTIPYIVNKFITPVDIWINIPFGATDDYVLQVAQLMLNQLNPSINIYVEYSNEVWNYIFTQASANLRDANVSVLNQGDPLHLAYDNNTNVGYWAFRRTASQIKRISDLFKTVFGQQNVGPWKRIRPILAGQSTNPIVITQGLDYISNVYGPPSNYLHGIAIAPYFDLAQYKTWSNLTTDQVIDGLNSSIQTYLPEQGWSVTGPIGVHGTYAAWYGLAVHGYEGGPDTASGCGSCSLQAKINATRDGRMTNLCTQFLNGWYRYGFQPLNCSIPLTFGIPIPSYNVNSTNFMNHRVPYTDPWLRNLGPNSTFYYPLQILQSPMTINVTVYVAGNSGTLEASINNADFIQVRTPSTGNYTNFQPAPIFQFTITKTVIPSIVTLRLKNIINGYSILGFDVTSWSPTTTTTVASTS
ncbi:unnamed protein product [Didymodactylos carnosus]|uniref:Uncharacterized protein n=1 Tax=Didymodactylos carnosus TaxID=1234261 RepID=A0A814WWR7_9BILA|nr:unnamed protein product [Didymodactylos carnosus]CAF3972184.1 unnamed protein product [Didymodactylos carnosus]